MYSGVLIAGTKIIGLLGDAETRQYEELIGACNGTIIDAKGMVIVPGFIDPHVHITGGGGEMGPASRTPEMSVSALVAAGITTIVGVTGTDSVSRSLENLLTKARALTQDGLTAYLWTGAYRVPTPTLTGTVSRDICLIEQCIGVGEIEDRRERGAAQQYDVRLLRDERRCGQRATREVGTEQPCEATASDHRRGQSRERELLLDTIAQLVHALGLRYPQKRLRAEVEPRPARRKPAGEQAWKRSAHAVAGEGRVS